jgi:hypothetical protein
MFVIVPSDLLTTERANRRAMRKIPIDSGIGIGF